MGVSTDANICYGIFLDEDYEYPWGDEWEETWWRETACGYRPPFELFNERGDWIDGKEPDKEIVSEYFDHQRNFEKAHPMPFELVNYCSGEFPMCILAVPGTVTRASRGYPKEINPLRLVVSSSFLLPFEEFCKEFGFSGERKWWLSSYYG